MIFLEASAGVLNNGTYLNKIILLVQTTSPAILTVSDLHALQWTSFVFFFILCFAAQNTNGDMLSIGMDVLQPIKHRSPPPTALGEKISTLKQGMAALQAKRQSKG